MDTIIVPPINFCTSGITKVATGQGTLNIVTVDHVSLSLALLSWFLFNNRMYGLCSLISLTQPQRSAVQYTFEPVPSPDKRGGFRQQGHAG